MNVWIADEFAAENVLRKDIAVLRGLKENLQPLTSDRTRRLIAFDMETWQAIQVLAQDKKRTLQYLADEAFADQLFLF